MSSITKPTKQIRSERKPFWKLGLCAAFAILCFSLSGCIVQHGRELKDLQWIDEALLHDGRTIEVHRKISATSRVYPFYYVLVIERELNQESLEATNPDTGESIRWAGDRRVQPMMLDFVDGTPYLVASRFVFSNTGSYGCPDIPFVFLMYDETRSEWIPVPSAVAPESLRLANLFNGYYSENMGTRISKEKIASDYEYRGRRVSEMFIREIPRTFDAWRYRDKNRERYHRYAGDCRPPASQLLAHPVDTIRPDSPMPSSRGVELESLGQKDHEPPLVIFNESATPHPFWKENFERCNSMFEPADPRHENPLLKYWKVFVKDPTKKR